MGDVPILEYRRVIYGSSFVRHGEGQSRGWGIRFDGDSNISSQHFTGDKININKPAKFRMYLDIWVILTHIDCEFLIVLVSVGLCQSCHLESLIILTDTDTQLQHGRHGQLCLWFLSGE